MDASMLIEPIIDVITVCWRPRPLNTVFEYMKIVLMPVSYWKIATSRPTYVAL